MLFIKEIKANKALKTVLFLIVFTVFSGAIRRWVIHTGIVGNIILAIQLSLPLLFYFSLKNQFKWISAYSNLKSVFRFFVACLILLALNPLNLTIFHGILGILLYLALWLPIYTYLGMKESFEIEKLDNIIFIILAIQLIISGLQYTLPGDHILNVFASGKTNDAPVGDAMRASGTFSYLGGLQALMVFWGFFSWYSIIHNKNAILIFIIILSGFVCAAFTGSRSTIIYYSVFTFIGAISSGKLKSYSQKLIPFFVVISILLFFFPNNPIYNIINRSSENFQKRIEVGNRSGETNDRINNQFFSAFKYHGNYLIFGVGLGSTYQGATAVFGTSPNVASYGYLEDEPERIVVEGGYLLYFLRLFIFFNFLYVLSIPRWSKFIIFILFMNALVTFNIFMSIFLALGLIWVDRAHSLKKQS